MGGACSDTEPDRATNEIQTCERGPHVHIRHVNENAAKKNKKSDFISKGTNSDEFLLNCVFELTSS